MAPHPCPVDGCSISVPHDTFMCARHWRMVPKPLQAAIYEDYGRDGCRGDNHREALRIVNDSESGRAALDLPAGTKAFTIWQPWASLVIAGAKPHEFRRWKFTDKPTLAKLVGQRIVIHAGVRPPVLSEVQDVIDRIEFGESDLVAEVALPLLTGLAAELAARERGQPKPRGSLPLGAALGAVTLGDPKSVLDLFADADSDRLDHHMYGWPMIDPVPFAEPISAAGAQGFWNWS